MNERGTYECHSYPYCDVIDNLKIQVIKPGCFCVAEFKYWKCPELNHSSMDISCLIDLAADR